MSKNEETDIIDLVNGEIVQAAELNIDPTENINWNDWDVNTPAVRTAASKALRLLKERGIMTMDSLLPLCESLLDTGQWPHRTIAFQWSFSLKKQFQPRHFAFLDGWVNTYLHSWGSCDDLCTHSMGYFLMKHPQFVESVKKWVQPDNPYVRRAAAVSFIYALRKGKLFEHIFDISDNLMHDTHHHVLKGYGWMLKEATLYFMNDVFEYVMENKEHMPRLSLRYAIEKMPKDMRKKAMA
ncbi:DNA alkylation repair protein [Candidatus Thorarchaeota archaeon]|nr:MAG: DNA alkylation repair protein [Candidatus Thorarchaeota archaeon]